MAKPRMCRNCRAFVPPNAKVCEYCGENLGLTYQQKTVREERVKFIPSESFLTAVILLLNVGLFIATYVMSQKFGGPDGFGRALRLLGWMDPGLILGDGQTWRLITAGFLHGGIFHIGMNGMALFQIGPIVEEVFGWARFLVIYIGATIGGFFASLLWSVAGFGGASVGASAAICGLIGAMIAVTRRSGTPILQTVWGRWALMLVVIGLLPILRVDNAAHFGGFVAGYFIGWVGMEPRLKGKDADSAWALLAGVAAVVTGYCFFRSYQYISGFVAAVS